MTSWNKYYEQHPSERVRAATDMCTTYRTIFDSENQISFGFYLLKNNFILLLNNVQSTIWVLQTCIYLSISNTINKLTIKCFYILNRNKNKNNNLYVSFWLCVTAVTDRQYGGDKRTIILLSTLSCIFVQ